MQRIKLLGLAVMALFAFSAVAAAVASAENDILPGAGTTATGKVGEGLIETLAGSKIKCKKGKGTGEVTSERLGTVTVEFEECTSVVGGVTVKCADLSRADSAGIVKVEGEFHLRMGLSGQPLGIIAALVNSVHFLCSIALFVVKGCAAGEITPINTLVSTLTGKLRQEKGENTIKSIDNNAETAMEECSLKIKKGSEAEETMGVEGEATLEAFKKGGSAVTVLVMI